MADPATTRPALPHLATVSAANPQDTALSLKVAALEARFGRDKEFAATRQRISAFARDTGDMTTAERAATACCLLPAADKTELEAALRLARKGVELGNGGGAWNLLALGMAQLRDAADADATLSAAAAADRNNRFVPGQRRSTGRCACPTRARSTRPARLPPRLPRR